MGDNKTRVILADLSGGRNGADPPLGPDFKPNQVTDAVNVDWYRTTGMRKRYGSANISMTGSGMVGVVSWLGRHVPATSEADAELWAVDEASPGTFTRLDNSVSWANPTATVDPPTAGSAPWAITSASLDGLFFIAYNSGVNRLHVWDARTATIRRTGVTAGTFTAAYVNDGGAAGAYPAILRYYRTRYLIVAGGVLISRSEPSAIVAFTPSGIFTSARVSLPGNPAGDAPTHWEVEISTDGVTFYQFYGFDRGNHIAIGTLFVDDVGDPAANVAALAAIGGLLSALTGTYSLQKSYRFIAADQNRLVGFGNYVATEKQSRIEISAVVGSLDRGDAERVDTTSTYYYDLDEKDSGVPTALVGPMFGNFYPMKTRQLWELAPTGSVMDPYRRTAISKELGCVSAHGACIGEDRDGNPCLYTMTHRGVYRYGLTGLTYDGRGIEDLILGPTSVMNMAATKVICHLVYHPNLRQLWVWFATGSSNEADALCVLNVRTGGWARYTGTIAQARCSVMFANSIGSVMGFSLVPYIGSSTAVNRVTRCDDTAVTQDAGVSYQATITTKPIEPAGTGMRGHTGDAIVLAPAAAGVTLTATITPDFNAGVAKSGTALLTASALGETRVSKRLEGSSLGLAQFVQITLGDGAAANNAWSVDRVTIPVGGQEPVS